MTSPAVAAPLAAPVLTGKVAFVPGGSGVLGQAIAFGLARAGARVVVGGTDEAKLRGLSAALSECGQRAEAVAFDARQVKDIARAVDAVCDYFGRCDILLNCVGIH